MLVSPACRSPRRGVIAPLAAILTIFILGMVAFAVDISWIVEAEAELQNAADAAALAGVSQLMTNFVACTIPGQSQATKDALLDSAKTQARATAKQYAAANNAGGVK